VLLAVVCHWQINGGPAGWHSAAKPLPTPSEIGMTRYSEAIPAGRPHNSSPIAQPFILRRKFAEIQVVKFVEHGAPLFQGCAIGEGRKCPVNTCRPQAAASGDAADLRRSLEWSSRCSDRGSHRVR
jgi:hypothetical protein